MTDSLSSPLVSILIPVYNREGLIIPCIQSALEQTVANIEVVVVDNASTDGTWRVCQDLAARDSRIRVFRNDSNLGPVRNWLRCVAEARGEYGKILFSDDLMAPDFLGKTLPFLDHDDVSFVFSPAVVGPEPFVGTISYQFTKQTGVFPSARFISMALFNGDLPLSPGSALFRMQDLRKSLLLTIPSPTIKDFPSHGAGPDILLYLITAARYPKVAYVYEPLSYFRAHDGSITVSKKKVYITQCYRQARLWFAEQYLADNWLKRLYVYEWKRESKERGKWDAASNFIGRYTEKKFVLSLLDMVYGLTLSKVVKKGLVTLRPGKALAIDVGET